MSVRKTETASGVRGSYEQYMDRVGKERIPCYEPSMGEEEIAFVTDVIRRNWLSENKYTREFEQRLAVASERRYSVCLTNATTALICGMRALGLGSGDEVIVPSLAHSADPNAIVNAGAVPVFADVDESTLCLSVATIDAVRSARTRAILFIAAYGNAGGLDEVERYARDQNLHLINDSAPAVFGRYKGRSIAAYGEFSVLSFFADKTITTGEGGMLLTDRLDLIDTVNIHKHDGRRERGVDLIEHQGFNGRITELQTAVGVAQLNRADSFVSRKKEILRTYAEKLSGTPNVNVFRFAEDGDISPHRIIVFVPDAAALIDHLTSRGIGARTLFMPMHSMPAYNDRSEFPVTGRLFRTGVCLPSAPTLTEENIDTVCRAIGELYGGQRP